MQICTKRTCSRRQTGLKHLKTPQHYTGMYGSCSVAPSEWDLEHLTGRAVCVSAKFAMCCPRHNCIRVPPTRDDWELDAIDADDVNNSRIVAIASPGVLSLFLYLYLSGCCCTTLQPCHIDACIRAEERKGGGKDGAIPCRSVKDDSNSKVQTLHHHATPCPALSGIGVTDHIVAVFASSAPAIIANRCGAHCIHCCIPHTALDGGTQCNLNTLQNVHSCWRTYSFNMLT